MESQAKKAYNCAPWDSNFEQNKPLFRSEKVILSGADPFETLKISDTKLLDNIEDREPCPKCLKSRKYYCYLCHLPLKVTKPIIPRLSCPLPCKVDIIKDPREVDGKSTAVHAKIICPEDVRIFSYPELPDYSNEEEKVLLLFPGPSASSLEDITEECQQTFKSDQKFRVIFIDSTWKQTPRILNSLKKYNLQQIQIADRETLFWRYQTGLSKKHLATIEVRKK